MVVIGLCKGAGLVMIDQYCFNVPTLRASPRMRTPCGSSDNTESRLLLYYYGNKLFFS